MPSFSPLRTQALQPFPPLPWELKAAIIKAGTDEVSVSPFHQVGDQHEATIHTYRFLLVCMRVNKDFASIALSLLYTHISLSTVSNGKRFLKVLTNPDSLSSTFLPRPLRSYIRTLAWATWEPSNLPQEFNYKAIISIRQKLISILFRCPGVTSVEFPTVVWPLLREFENLGSEGLGRLKGLGTILAVENRSLSEVLAYPVFRYLEDLSVWYGDPATGMVDFPATLKTLRIRCDHFHQGNNIPLRDLSFTETRLKLTHLPQLRKLDFSFTTKRYPEATPWDAIPNFLSAIGSTITHLCLSTDRSSSPRDALLSPHALLLCPNLLTLELQNHRMVTSSDVQELYALGHKTLSRVHYRLDMEDPCGAETGARNEQEWTQASPPKQMDLMVLNELKELFINGRKMFPRLNRLSIGAIPMSKWTIQVSHTLASLLSLEDLPGVTVVDEWDRSLRSVLYRRNAPFLSPQSSVDPIVTDETLVDPSYPSLTTLALSSPLSKVSGRPQSLTLPPTLVPSLLLSTAMSSPASSTQGATPGLPFSGAYTSSSGSYFVNRSTPLMDQVAGEEDGQISQAGPGLGLV